MHKRVQRLLLVAACAFALAGSTSAQGDLSEREAKLLAQVRAEGGADPQRLVALARVREQLGNLPLALDTWGLLKKFHGDKQALNNSSAPEHTYGEVADFWMHRLRRKQRLAAHPPPSPNRELRLRLAATAGLVAATAWGNRDGQVDLLVQADLDGDLIDEVFLVGKYGPLGARSESFMCLAKWEGDQYEIVWRHEEEGRFRLFPFSFGIVDRDGDGWKEVSLGFEPETDNAATLYLNGSQAITGQF